MSGTAGSAARVCVVVLNWNGWKDTISCLESLRDADYPNWSVVVIDNGSTDESVERLTSWVTDRAEAGGAVAGTATTAMLEGDLRGRVSLVRMDRNLGFAGGVNAGASHAMAQRADYVWLLNNDAVVHPQTLSALVRCAESDGFDVVGSLVCEDAAANQVEFARGNLPWDLFGLAVSRTHVPQARASWPSDWVTFASALIARGPIEDRLRSKGYVLDPRLFMYVEDVDFCYFCQRRGYRIGVSKAGSVVHRRSSSSGGTGSPRVYYYITRNRLRVAREWLGAVGYACFVGYFTATRLLLVTRHVLRGHLVIARAVTQALADGLTHKEGAWSHH